MKTLFEDIQAAIANLKGIKWVDWDLGQLEMPATERPPVDFPCVLFGISNINFGDAENIELNDTSFTLKIAFKVFNRSNNLTNPDIKEQALGHLDVITRIAKAVEALKASEHYSPPQRKNLTTRRQADPRVYELNFDCLVYDWTAEPDTESPDLFIEASIGFDLPD